MVVNLEVGLAQFNDQLIQTFKLLKDVEVSRFNTSNNLDLFIEQPSHFEVGCVALLEVTHFLNLKLMDLLNILLRLAVLFLPEHFRLIQALFKFSVDFNILPIQSLFEI